jgi:hypothetical protein
MGSVYKDYEIYKKLYYSMQNTYNKLLLEKERLFTKTLPDAIRYDFESVAGGKSENEFDEYMSALEDSKIDQRIQEAKQLLFERERLLLIKEKELRQSKDKYDVVYRMKYLDEIKPASIALALSYSESQIYRILDKIQKELRREK